MSATAILRNAKLIETGNLQKQDLFIKDGLINSIYPSSEKIRFDCNCPSYDLEGKYLFPGIFESHLHGSAGIDFNQIDLERLDQISIYLAGRGVTSFFVSIVSQEEEKLFELLRFYAWAAEKDLPGARLAGIHLEGPWISPRRSGAISTANLKTARPETLDRYQQAADGRIRYITVAPEVEGALDLIEKADAKGIVVGIGHTEADYDQGREAIARGAKLATHFGNAMPWPHQRQPGIVGALLESGLQLELIFDGVHVHPVNLRLIAQLVSLDRIIGITDATMARGLPDGDYTLGDMAIRVDKGISYLSDSDVLAGSTLDPIHAVHNAAKILDAEIRDVYPLFSSNPASLFSLNTGEIHTGKKADLLALNQNFKLCDTWVAGRHVFSAML